MNLLPDASRILGSLPRLGVALGKKNSSGSNLASLTPLIVKPRSTNSTVRERRTFAATTSATGHTDASTT